MAETLTRAQVRAATFVDWFIRSDYVDSRRFGSSSDMWIEDAERAQRVTDAAEDGADGSTHREIINDWREAFRDWVRFANKRNPQSAGYNRFESAVSAHFDDLEAWHTAHGSIDEEIG